MKWEAVILIVIFGFGAISSILLIGKDREPLTNGGAAIVVLTDLALIWLVLRLLG